MTSLRRAMNISSTITGTASTPLMTALQYSAEIGLIGVKFSAMPIAGRQRQHGVERGGFLRLAREPDRPSPPLADGIRGGAGEHRDRQQSGADDAERKNHFRECAGDRTQRFSRLRRGLDVGLAGRMQRRRGGDDDRQRDQVGERHADDGVGADAMEFLLRAIVLFDQRPLRRIDALVLGFLRGLPEEQIGRDRGAEDGDDGGEIVGAPGQARNEHAGQRLAPRHLGKGERGDIGEQAERQPFQHRHVALVIEEDLRHDRGHAEQQHVDDAVAADQQFGGVRHGAEIGARC